MKPLWLRSPLNLYLAEDLATVFNAFSAASAVVQLAPTIFGAIWSSSKKFSAVENAFNHWKKHKADFPDIPNAKNFAEFSDEFVKNPPSSALTKVRANGDIVIYDPSSEMFAVATSEGTPRTVFIPDPSIHGYPTNLDYFNAQ